MVVWPQEPFAGSVVEKADGVRATPEEWKMTRLMILTVTALAASGVVASAQAVNPARADDYGVSRQAYAAVAPASSQDYSYPVKLLVLGVAY
jgi:hypothetical protein